jgi:hypothetical protein
MPVIEKKPKWADKFASLVDSCWEHHGPCAHIHFKWAWDTDNKCWYILAAPVWQEVLGGEDDGKKVWTGFVFHSDAFAQANGIFIEKNAISSTCNSCSISPRALFAGKFRTHAISFQVYLEPLQDQPVVEIIDTINNTITEKEDDDDHDGEPSAEDHEGNEGAEPGERHSPGLPGETPGD